MRVLQFSYHIYCFHHTQHIQHGTIIFKVMESFRKRRYVNILENSFTHREFWIFEFQTFSTLRIVESICYLIRDRENCVNVCNLGNVMKNTQRTFMTQICSIYVFEYDRWHSKNDAIFVSRILNSIVRWLQDL